jgi:NAD(P)-dependent dehydrogenase (short-subunit alcohol dehydrogenase family)
LNPRRTALVTGASQGIGATIAVALARAGYDVAVTELSAPPLADTLRQVEAEGRRAVPVVLDLRIQESIDRALSEGVKALGHLDLLVNNAGVTLRRNALEVTPEEWAAVVDVNLSGTFFMTQCMGRYLVGAGRRGSVITLSSAHGMLGYPERSTYGITKAGLIHMTRTLAIEWAGHGIRVNAIAPGTIATPSRAAFFASDPVALKAMTDRIPLKRFGTTEEVAAMVCYLASPGAEYITGQTLVLEGGLTSY